MKLLFFILILFSHLIFSVAVILPHIFVIVADDYGWNNIGYHSKDRLNAAEIITPTLDSLKLQGIELDRQYVYRFCSPSRSALLSGRNPIHVNVRNDEFNYNAGDPLSGYAGVPLNMTLIPEKLRLAGYSTHLTGKWDVGWATTAHLPINRGFDSGLGFLAHSNDYWNFTGIGCHPALTDLWENHLPAYSHINPPGCSQANQVGCTYEDDLFVKNVLDNLDAHDPKKPLFYYYALHNIHEPLQVPESYLDKFDFITNPTRQFYSAMVNYLDDTVDKVVDKLKDKGMWNDTLILFVSDNGGAVYSGGGASNFPLKGGKNSNWEGGIRVNAFLTGGFLPVSVRGTKLKEFIGIEDWYATFCALAGVDYVDKVAADSHLPAVDGLNMWPLLSGTNRTNPRTQIWIGQDVNNQTIVQGIIIPPYKLLINQVAMSFWQGPFYPNTTGKSPADNYVDCGQVGCLFDIISDPTEHNNIQAQNVEIAATLREAIRQVQTTVFAPFRGRIDQTQCAFNKANYQGFKGPWITHTIL